MNFKIRIAGSDGFRPKAEAVAGCLKDLVDQVTSLGLDVALQGVLTVRIVETPEVGRRLYIWRDDHRELSIYPGNFRQGADRVDLVFYQALGERFECVNMDAGAHLTWSTQVIQADRACVEGFQNNLRKGETYEEALRHFQDPVQRLGLIHLINALKANSIPESRARILDFDEYPPTQGLLSGKYGLSIKPLTSAYYKDSAPFSEVFADYCANNGKIPTSSPSVSRAMVLLFESVAA